MRKVHNHKIQNALTFGATKALITVTLHNLQALRDQGQYGRGTDGYNVISDAIASISKVQQYLIEEEDALDD